MANSAQEKLEAFVGESLRAGIARPDIERTLRAADWTPDQISAALRAYAPLDFPVPVPRPRPQLTSRDFFVYALLFTTLYLTTFNLGRVFFELIDLRFPDAATLRLEFRGNPKEGLRWAVSWLCVASPVFLGLSYALDRSYRSQPGRRLSPVRRLLTYLTLFVAAVSVICDFATLLFYLLDGDLTTRVVLKGLVVCAIAGAAFAYYLADLRREENAP